MPVLTDSQRPVCMPGAKDERFLPRIPQRGSSSDSESLADYRRGIPRVPSSADTSASSSPVKLPAINGKSKSNSVSSLSNGMSPTRGQEEHRSNLCRSPSCPSNLGFWYERDGDMETPTPDNNVFCPPSKRGSSELKLPNIKDRNSMCSGNSQITVRTLGTQRSPTRNGVTRDFSPVSTRRDPSVHSTFKLDAPKEVQTPRGDHALDSQRSTNQSALLLPIRNSESRLSIKKKKKKKKQGSRQNTEVSLKSEDSVVNETNAGPSETFEKVKSKMDTIDSRGYFSEAEATGDLSDDRCISRVTEENKLSKPKENVVGINKRHKMKKRVTDNNLYFERELTQVNA